MYKSVYQKLKTKIMKKETPVYNDAEPRKCGCGKTQDANGNCDGSHAS